MIIEIRAQRQLKVGQSTLNLTTFIFLNDNLPHVIIK